MPDVIPAALLELFRYACVVFLFMVDLACMAKFAWDTGRPKRVSGGYGVIWSKE